ncbi:unnamed protein product [Symbiodinium necroappetens]|uniref:Protein kinase domain-containing protein n=1 Tax=Symbiodinium necroappetens TaxID=1628268 RepID=A0A812SAT5_9DINO|nr:unnamed protein product [Symbiodinium necroappetens]
MAAAFGAAATIAGPAVLVLAPIAGIAGVVAWRQSEEPETILAEAESVLTSRMGDEIGRGNFGSVRYVSSRAVVKTTSINDEQGMAEIVMLRKVQGKEEIIKLLGVATINMTAYMYLAKCNGGTLEGRTFKDGTWEDLVIQLMGGLSHIDRFLLEEFPPCQPESSSESLLPEPAPPARADVGEGVEEWQAGAQLEQRSLEIFKMTLEADPDKRCTAEAVLRLCKPNLLGGGSSSSSISGGTTSARRPAHANFWKRVSKR